MEITLNYQGLAEVAKEAILQLVTEDEDGLYIVKHSSVKLFAKVFLWMVLESDGDTIEEAISQLDEEMGVQDLYCRLEDEGKLEISKKDLIKYKFYTDLIYSHIKMAESLNEIKAKKATLKLAEQTQALAESFKYLGDQIREISEEDLKEKAETIDSFLKEIGQRN